MTEEEAEGRREISGRVRVRKFKGEALNFLIVIGALKACPFGISENVKKCILK